MDEFYKIFWAKFQYLGIVSLPGAFHPPPSAQELLRKADRAMYGAKRAGKSQVKVCGGPENEDARPRSPDSLEAPETTETAYLD